MMTTNKGWSNEIMAMTYEELCLWVIIRLAKKEYIPILAWHRIANKR